MTDTPVDQHPSADSQSNRSPSIDHNHAFEHLVYDGETLEASFGVADTLIGVTSHRVLVLHTNDDHEPNFQPIHRPNITDITVNTTGQVQASVRALRYSIYALVLLGTGSMMNLGNMIQPVDAPSGSGIGSALTLVNTITDLLALLDNVLQWAGVVFLFGGLYFLARYLYSRNQTLEFIVSGTDPIRIPIRHPITAKTTAKQLAEILLTDPGPQRAPQTTTLEYPRKSESAE